MAELKSKLGNPRPGGMSLSRICDIGCDRQYQISDRRGMAIVCNDPNHYIWESIGDNNARRANV